MRSTALILMVTCAALPFVQCSSSDDSSPAASTDAGADVTDSAVNKADSAIADSSTTTGLTLDGTVYAMFSSPPSPLANRKVVVVDANDVVTDLTTDASGKFHATGVMPPYDVSVPYDVPDAASGVYPFFYSGLATASPEIGAQDYVFPSNPMQFTTVQFETTICAGCQLTLSGPQRTADVVAGTGSLQVFQINYSWYGSATLSVPLHMVVADTAGTYTERADVPSTALVATGTTTLDPPTFTAITSGTFALTATIPAGYTYATSELTVEANNPADYSSFVDLKLTTPTTTTNYPIIPGSNFYVGARARGVGAEESDAFLTYPIASTPASMAVTVPTAPQITAPANNATGVTSSQSLAWMPYGTDAVYELTLRTGISSLKIFTTSTSVSLAKLAKAEIGLAPTTAYSWTADGTTNEATVFGTLDSPPAATTFYDGESQELSFTTQ